MHIIQTRDNTHFQIALLVIAMHAVFLCWIILVPASQQEKKQPKKLVVKTIQLNPSPAKTIEMPNSIVSQPKPLPINAVVPQTEPLPPIPIVEPIPEPAPKLVEEPKIQSQPQPIEKPLPQPVAKKTEPTVKKTEVKKPISTKAPEVKKAIAPPKPIAKTVEPAKKNIPKVEVQKKQTPKSQVQKTTAEKPKIDPKIEEARVKAQLELQEKQKKLIAAAQESMAKIDKGRAKINETKSTLSSVSMPVAIASLQIEALPTNNAPALSKGESNYRDELASRLKLMLKLPEHGDVQLKLTLDRTGKVTKVAIIKSASSANRSYAEKNLPSLKFPPFGSHFNTMSEYTFMIQLSNEL